MRHDACVVIGGGAFGTCMAQVYARNFKTVFVKVRSQDVYQGMKEQRQNLVYLPNFSLAENLVPILEWSELDTSLQNRSLDLLVSGLPTAATRPFLQSNFDRLSGWLKQGMPFVSLSKGIDPETLELPDDVIFQIFPTFRDQVVFLSGPSFAKEVMEQQITAVSIASRSRETMLRVAEMTDTDYFRCLPNYDVKGVLLGGALKNSLAIGVGVLEGLGFNDNTRAAFITRGINEMLRFGKVFNARPETFYGLSGMGDLILTTTGGLSRNKQFGLELASGRKADDILKEQRTVVEGYRTAKAAKLLASRYHIRTTLFDGIYDIMYHDLEPRVLIAQIMSLPTRFES
jgi:glycerol-3-phosphate dehydrogenase (NAD(P)+)